MRLDTDKIRVMLVRHMLDGATREQAAAACGISSRSAFRHAPVTDRDRLHAGMMVNIGGILARRCAQCEVTKRLDDFPPRSSNASGCGSTCLRCLDRG